MSRIIRKTASIICEYHGPLVLMHAQADQSFHDSYMEHLHEDI